MDGEGEVPGDLSRSVGVAWQVWQWFLVPGHLVVGQVVVMDQAKESSRCGGEQERGYGEVQEEFEEVQDPARHASSVQVARSGCRIWQTPDPGSPPPTVRTDTRRLFIALTVVHRAHRHTVIMYSTTSQTELLHLTTFCTEI